MFVNFLFFKEVFPTLTNNTSYRITKGTTLLTFSVTIIEYISCGEFAKLSFAFFVSLYNLDNVFITIPECVYVTQYLLLYMPLAAGKNQLCRLWPTDLLQHYLLLYVLCLKKSTTFFFNCSALLTTNCLLLRIQIHLHKQNNLLTTLPRPLLVYKKHIPVSNCQQRILDTQ